jgi:hypothetical protein
VARQEKKNKIKKTKKRGENQKRKKASVTAHRSISSSALKASNLSIAVARQEKKNKIKKNKETRRESKREIKRAKRREQARH